MNVEIGIGKHDITGPCAEIGFMGYVDFGQKGAGIHSRLFSRAFVIEDMENERKSVVIVNADLGLCSQAVQQAVVKKLIHHFGGLYTDKNVLISATHTHSGPGGYSHSFIYNASMLGFNKQNFKCIVDGIFQSIVKAHENKTKGKILIAKGVVRECGKLRSEPAYLNNPQNERALYVPPEFREMTFLKFVDDADEPIGSINWFAVHPTNMGQKNKLISGDNKGYAEELFEKEKGIISAFANSCCGDISPNINGGPPDGINDFSRTMEFGTAQYQKAIELFDNTIEKLVGNVDYRQKYVDMSNCLIEETNNRTWPAAMGLGMTPGSSEDSVGVPIWPEGTTREKFEEDPNKIKQALGRILPAVFDLITPRDLDEEYIEGHAEKPILIPLGLLKINGAPMVPSILPVQLIRLGSLVLISHPGEMTTMAGRRMREDTLKILENDNVKHTVVATYAGAFNSYTTTREEYAMQHYEGASTLYGPWTLKAFQQENKKLAQAMINRKEEDPGPQPRDYSRNQISLQASVWFDDKPPERKFGDVLKQPRSSYRRGEKVEVKFQGAHPNNDLRIEDTYLRVEQLDSGSWRTVYTDKDFCTYFKWKRSHIADSIVTIEWDIPTKQVSGTYRIRYFGNWKRLGGKPRINAFSGESRQFAVT